MRPLKSVTKGIVVGLMVGMLSLIIAYTGLVLNGGPNDLPMAIVVSALGGSMAAGVLCTTSSYLVTGRERSILAPLVTVAVASLAVLPGNYVNGSLIPPAIYGMALVNGLIVALVIGPLCASGVRSGNRQLS